MPMDMSADNLAMLASDEFGASVATLDGVAIQGIFDAEYFEVQVGGDVGTESSQPGFLCRDEDLPADPRGKTLIVDGVSWTVVTPEPDGTGMTALVLREV